MIGGAAATFARRGSLGTETFLPLASSPEPLDARVTLREVQPSRVAVIQYGGFWSESNYDEHLVKLKSAMKAENLTWIGEPVFSRYNGPTTPWFMRRNEIWLHVSDKPV